MSIIASLLPEVLRAIDRGVKIRLLVSHRFTPLSSLLSMQGEENFGMFKKGVDIRFTKNLNSCFGIIDESAVVLSQLHPTIVTVFFRL
ncbi:hypothetical protein SAMN02910340_00647 [Methanosarcina thermophila]|jgi:hypothetical protein|uniref:Uncharacterized protein n=3 Tax=Methanosarcina thermophila TaxID=2210 RepID=A0A1I6XXZ8_METTE|nr:hypothetical protein [Methanosarcina thermophila]AKB12770.1 Transcriptional regulator, TrmB family [Methanosarcina thermophila TM-1]AKB16612.1 Transcriptional regulator, TrmB family [Methanosarcina thermophila CHTI-55]SFT42953.1 hypothetical protein SAMN02910340_00647 [Methanosarcina thermophila]BAW30509.1 conserved hypothetical protein [Methanosarcina thermophila]GLI13390.1 hypothetical protein MTHERMMSTA1_05160 [Methanosarcina thermophila MST-A1]